MSVQLLALLVLVQRYHSYAALPPPLHVPAVALTVSRSSENVATGFRVNLGGATTVIEQGLTPDDQVVTDGQLRLTPGAKVSIKPAVATKDSPAGAQ